MLGCDPATVDVRAWESYFADTHDWMSFSRSATGFAPWQLTKPYDTYCKGFSQRNFILAWSGVPEASTFVLGRC